MVADERALLRKGLWLEYATLAWNVVGVLILAGAAIEARSVALAGFGLDSLIEILASAVVVWQLKGAGKGRERAALRIVAVSFVLLAAYIAIQAGYVLWTGARPAPSPVGALWLLATVLAMLALAAGKRAVGRALGNQVLISESRVTLVDARLATSMLVGVGLNVLLGWWQADPISGLVIVIYAAMEARAAWRHSG